MYWTATFFAAAIAVWDLANFLYGLSEGQPIIRVAALALAAAIWLFGWGCRCALADR